MRYMLITGQWNVLDAVSKVENTGVSEEEPVQGGGEGSRSTCKV